MKTVVRNRRRRMGLLAAAAVTIMSLGWPASLTASDAPGRPHDPAGVIVFESDRGDGYYLNLYSVRPDGTDLVRLTDGEWDDSNAVWSPDGKRIAFSSSRDDLNQSEIYLMNADGSHLKRLTNTPAFDYAPSWSLDGRSLVFVTKDGAGPREVFTMRADGSHVTKVPNLPAGSNDWPSFMGKDKLLVHHRESPTSDSYLFSVRTDGSDLRQLTPDSLQAGPGTWTSHGDMITFENNYCGACDWAHIFTMKGDGRKIRQIEDVYGNENLFPSWSPDGRQITFSSFSLTHPVFTGYNIHTIDVDGSNEFDVTDSPAWNYQSSWGCADRTCTR